MHQQQQHQREQQQQHQQFAERLSHLEASLASALGRITTLEHEKSELQGALRRAVVPKVAALEGLVEKQWEKHDRLAIKVQNALFSSARKQQPPPHRRRQQPQQHQFQQHQGGRNDDKDHNGAESEGKDEDHEDCTVEADIRFNGGGPTEDTTGRRRLVIPAFPSKPQQQQQQQQRQQSRDDGSHEGDNDDETLEDTAEKQDQEKDKKPREATSVESSDETQSKGKDDGDSNEKGTDPVAVMLALSRDIADFQRDLHKVTAKEQREGKEEEEDKEAAENRPPQPMTHEENNSAISPLFFRDGSNTDTPLSIVKEDDGRGGVDDSFHVEEKGSPDSNAGPETSVVRATLMNLFDEESGIDGDRIDGSARESRHAPSRDTVHTSSRPDDAAAAAAAAAKTTMLDLAKQDTLYDPGATFSSSSSSGTSSPSSSSGVKPPHSHPKKRAFGSSGGSGSSSGNKSNPGGKPGSPTSPLTMPSYLLSPPLSNASSAGTGGVVPGSGIRSNVVTPHSQSSTHSLRSSSVRSSSSCGSGERSTDMRRSVEELLEADKNEWPLGTFSRLKF